MKIRELHQMMLNQGLKGSVEMLVNCIDEQGKPKTGKKNNVQTKVLNNNGNATIKPNSSKSEATIYESAIPKRTSSSSEEDAMEISDESLENKGTLLFLGSVQDSQAMGRHSQKCGPEGPQPKQQLMSE